MEKNKTNWTKEEFRAYILIYCANADFVESEEEKEMIKSKVSAETFKLVHKEFDGDSDFQRIQKIQFTAKELGYSKEEISSLIEELKELFMSDGTFDILEKNLLKGLMHLLN
jgi:uncharacterized protein YihD (DUF1040 family)